jgi:sugar phosphate isomerase/epimerase
MKQIDRLAVCSWSLQAANPAELISRVENTGIPRLQIALDPLRDAPATWSDTPNLLRKSGISMVSGMFGCVGEDYRTLESIRRTGGIAPDGTWEQNWKNAQASAALAQQLGLKLVTFHAGFLPHDERDANFEKMLRRLREVAEIFGVAEVNLGLETGQETAPVLAQLLRKLNRPNVGVNFDPANMLLYDKGNPIEALQVLGPWIQQVHIKDARRTKDAGTWGQEVTVGTGEVDWKAFFVTLKQLNFSGNFIIEREAGNQRVADIKEARRVVERAW